MKSVFLMFFLLVVNIVSAQSVDQQFSDANKNYQNGKFEQAVGQYQAVIKSGYQSADLYYNLANTYYKLNEIAPSIYYYEKALLLAPSHQEAKNNLMYARRSTVDVIEPLPKTVMQNFNEHFLYVLSYNTWGWLSIVFSLASCVLFLLYYFSQYTHIKKRYFLLSSIALLLLIVTLLIGIKVKHHFYNEQPAIVFAQKVSVNNEPMNSVSEAFVLHEGTKVYVKEYNDDWCRVEIADGKTGWLQKGEIKLIK